MHEKQLLKKFYTARFYILRFPKDGIILYAELHDQGQEFLEKESGTSTLVPILGLLQITSEKVASSYDTEVVYKTYNEPANKNDKKSYVEKQTNIMPGRLVVYGDSNCIDDSHLQKCMYCKKQNILKNQYFKNINIK